MKNLLFSFEKGSEKEYCKTSLYSKGSWHGQDSMGWSQAKPCVRLLKWPKMAAQTRLNCWIPCGHLSFTYCGRMGQKLSFWQVNIYGASNCQCWVFFFVQNETPLYNQSWAREKFFASWQPQRQHNGDSETRKNIKNVKALCQYGVVTTNRPKI